jgi:hypothetical protein
MLRLFDKPIVPTRQLLRAIDLDKVPEGAGLYFIFVKDGRGVLRRAGIEFKSADAPIRVDRHDLLYIGQSESNIRGRLKSHLANGSEFRSLMGSLVAAELASVRRGPNATQFFDDDELTGWMCANSKFTSIEMAEPKPVEKFLIRYANPPLNLYFRKTDPVSKRLMQGL